MEDKQALQKMYPLHSSHLLSFRWLFAFRLLGFLFCVWTIFVSVFWYYYKEPKAYYDDIIYFTNQVLYLQTIHFFVGMIVMYKKYSTPRFDKFINYFVYMLATEKFVVVAIFWGAIFKGSYGNSWQDMSQIQPHSVTFIFMQLEAAFITTICTAKMYLVTITYLIVYGIFNCLWTLNKYNIYSVLKWKDTMTYIWLLITIILSALFHFGVLMGLQNIHKRKYIRSQSTKIDVEMARNQK